MLCKFDHLSLVVADLGRTAADFAQLGFHVADRHDAGESETENRLICFDDGSYLEIMAFKDPSRPSANRWWSLLSKGDGWVDYSLHTDDMDAEVRRLSEHGAPMVGPKAAGKTRQDGLDWKVQSLLLGRGVTGPLLPFLIEDAGPRAVRVPPPPSGMTQPDGIAGIAAITLATADLEKAEKSLAALFGAGTKIPTRHAGASDARLYQFGGHAVEVVEARDSSSEIGRYMNVRGEGVFEVTLGAIPYMPGAATKMLPVEKTHGARLRSPGGR
jgi:hypothetical protein